MAQRFPFPVPPRVTVTSGAGRERLGTDKLPVARVRAREGLLEHHINPQKKDTPGTLASLEEEYLKRLSNDPDIAPGTIEYKKSLLAALRKCWPPYSARSIANLTNLDLIGCRTILAQKYAPTRTNGAITVIRELLDLAEKQGAVHDVDRLLKDVEFVRVAGVNLRKLPSKAQFDALRAGVYRRSKVTGTWGMLLFDFLAYSGCRVESARCALWEDVNWERNEFYFRKAKRGPYTIPLFPQLKEFLTKLKEAANPKPGDKIIPTKSIRKLMENACATLRIPKLCHHDLRHLFATRAIEANVDIPTVSRWLGHKDGGALAMRVYGHLRNEHSQKMAELLK